jgi:tRNA(Ile)-lysidine synthase
MSINNKIRQSLARQNHYFAQTDRFLLAVSGGIDSQCLLLSMPHILGPSRCFAVGVNHGLRPEASAELDLAEALAVRVGVPFKRINIQVERGGNLQARARDARYEALRQAKEECDANYIVTAHHANDRAETFLFRLIRGKGLGSLAVMPELNGDIYRPMLEVTREEIEKHLKCWGVNYARDPSNEDEHYTRVWIRKTLIPMLQEKNPQINNRINDIVEELLQDKT